MDTILYAALLVMMVLSTLGSLVGVYQSATRDRERVRDELIECRMQIESLKRSLEAKDAEIFRLRERFFRESPQVSITNVARDADVKGDLVGGDVNSAKE